MLKSIVHQLEVLKMTPKGTKYAKEQVPSHLKSRSKVGLIVDSIFNEVFFVETLMCFFVISPNVPFLLSCSS